MNFGATRLGFWYRPQTNGRNNRPGNTLVVFDYLTNVDVGWVDYPYIETNWYINQGDVNPKDNIYPVIQARQTALNYNTTLITSYAELATTDLSQYSQIWDIGYATDLNSSVQSIYLNFLVAGGSLYLTGENVLFNNRNASICDFLTNVAGAGNVTFHRTSEYYTQRYVETVSPEFLLANSDNSIGFDAPNVFDSWGTGTRIATGGSTLPTAVMWKTGSLANAPKGAIVSVLDVNYFTNLHGNMDYNPDFVDNISRCMILK